MLNDLKEEADETVETTNPYALAALQEIMQVRGHSVFPVLIPTLLSVPLTSFNARALGSLITVSGNTLSKRLTSILPALMTGLEQADDAVDAIQQTLGILLSQISGADSLHQIMTTLFEILKTGSESQKASACLTLQLVCQNTTQDISDYVADWLLNLVSMMSGREGTKVLKAAWGALDALVKRIKKEEMDRYVSITWRGVKDAEQYLSEDESIPGYCLPKVRRYSNYSFLGNFTDLGNLLAGIIGR